jgi:hypothetical protein
MDGKAALKKRKKALVGGAPMMKKALVGVRR